MTEKLKKLAPPGADLGADLRSFGLLVFLAWFLSGLFLIRYETAFGRLFETAYDHTTLRSGAVMLPAGEVLHHSMAGFTVTVIAQAANVVRNYRMFTEETKSIYLMKRLSASKELHIRCWALPLLFSAAAVLIAFLLIGIDLAYYYLRTPAECLPPSMQLQLLRIFL